MAIDVTKTNPKPIVKIDRRFLQKLFQEVYQAASNNNGGKKTKKTTSGLILNTGKPGINDIANPPITSKIGYEILKRWETTNNMDMKKNRIMTNNMLDSIIFAN
ncbi:hypothetical protein GCM10011516_30080 [Sphingobacterium cellulitidis]|uniref:Uncharacterized protein n=1 Tax=Sphingobacterium cellulitidis TaxID=1768011 RepID=A0A8H9G3W9_9SPHI|nr:hypothetical protein GCM10011516_30080 [Sphingobacterium soli]